MNHPITAAALEAANTPLETARLHLEPLHAAHAAELFGQLADPQLYCYVPQEPPVSLEWLAWRYGLLASRLSTAGDELWLNWVLRLKSGSTCIGTVQVTVRGDGSAYLAYELGSAFWGQGYAGEACGRVLDALAADFGVTRVEAEVDTRNTASIRLLERLGFANTALRRDADFFKGATSDEFCFERVLGPAPAAPCG